MIEMTKNDLQYNYQWNAIPPDDPRLTGAPDSTLLNRNEGYEVLTFLRRISKNLAGAKKAERMIQQHLPGTIRSHKNVLQWLIDNWNTYQ